MINEETIGMMKDHVILVNTSRGALIKTDDLIAGIRSRKFFGIGLDVYEEETPNVFENREDDILESSITARLLSFPKCDSDVSSGIPYRGGTGGDKQDHSGQCHGFP